MSARRTRDEQVTRREYAVEVRPIWWLDADVGWQDPTLPNFIECKRDSRVDISVISSLFALYCHFVMIYRFVFFSARPRAVFPAGISADAFAPSPIKS